VEQGLEGKVKMPLMAFSDFQEKLVSVKAKELRVNVCVHVSLRDLELAKAKGIWQSKNPIELNCSWV
jgi:hypothetical protein